MTTQQIYEKRAILTTSFYVLGKNYFGRVESGHFYKGCMLKKDMILEGFGIHVHL